jgi:hypothetical protein
MAKPTLNIENLPLSIDGKLEMVPKRQYCNHKAQTLTIKHKTDIKKGNVSDMLDMIVAGKELEEDNEQVWKDVYAELKADVDLAQEEAQRLIEEQEKKAQEEKDREEAEANRQKGLVAAATGTSEALTLNVLEHFDLGNMDRCIPKGEVSDETLMQALVVGMKMDNFTNWAKGDLVSELENRGCEKAMVTLCEQTGIPYKSIYRMAVTARIVPPEKRLPNVSFTTYAEVANARLSKDDAENSKKLTEVIDRIGEKPAKTGDAKKDEAASAGIITTSQEARKAVQEAQGKTPPTPPDPLNVDLEKHDFIIVNTEDGTVSHSKGFPKSLEDTEGVTIIHAKTARKAYGAGKKLKWTPLDLHEEPAPEPEKPAATPEPEKPAAPAAGAKKPAAKKKAAAAAGK